ncbi:HNH endonuclease [Pantoea stewartii subsp. indologenes]|uniref:HNH endonuclease n=1 Tax=Pantoea stewartii TaxID=66269 RepID=UPI003FA4194A
MDDQSLRNRILELFDYDADTGEFLMRISRGTVKKGNVAGHLMKCGYVRICINRKFYYAHRLAFLYVHGWMPEVIDHINGNTSDNRITNLREATITQNMWNARLSITNTSGVKGCSWHKGRGKWRAFCAFKGTRNDIGYFENLEEAKMAVEKFREEMHKEFANHGSSALRSGTHDTADKAG